VGLNDSAEHTYIECDCDHAEHILRFTRYSGLDELDKMLTVDVYLSNYMSLPQRIWYGIKYIFGFKSGYGAFDCVLLNKKNVKRLRDLCNMHLEALDAEEGNNGSV